MAKQLYHYDIKITGRVQGVGYRYFTRKMASDLDVRGRVRNEADGSVSIAAEGREDIVKHLIDLLKRGPTLSRVVDIKVNKYQIDDYKYPDFRVAY